MNKIFQKFIEELDVEPTRLAQIPLTKLSNIIGIVNLDNIEEWLTKAETLTSQDFNDDIRKAQGKESYLDCQHQEVDYKICSKCGNRHKV